MSDLHGQPRWLRVEKVTKAGDAGQGDWSPDGKRIAYVGFTSGDAAIWIVNADGTDRSS